MMGRLIDADEVISVLKQTNIIQDNDLGHLIVDEINRIPTAYDVDKVVEELEEMKSLSKDAVEYEIRYGSIEYRVRAEQSLKDLSKVINIVRKGGVE